MSLIFGGFGLIKIVKYCTLIFNTDLLHFKMSVSVGVKIVLSFRIDGALNFCTQARLERGISFTIMECPQVDSFF